MTARAMKPAELEACYGELMTARLALARARQLLPLDELTLRDTVERVQIDAQNVTTAIRDRRHELMRPRS